MKTPAQMEYSKRLAKLIDIIMRAGRSESYATRVARNILPPDGSTRTPTAPRKFRRK